MKIKDHVLDENGMYKDDIYDYLTFEVTLKASEIESFCNPGALLSRYPRTKAFKMYTAGDDEFYLVGYTDEKQLLRWESAYEEGEPRSYQLF